MRDATRALQHQRRLDYLRDQHQRRLDYLRDHPEVLDALPGADEDVDAIGEECLNLVLRQMQLVKLFAPTAAPRTTRDHIRQLVSELREGAKV